MKITRPAWMFGAAAAFCAALSGAAIAAPSERAQKVFDYWTAERIAAAKPRDLVIDHRGLGYLKGVDGNLTPYGHSVRPELTQIPTKDKREPNAKPGGGGGADTTPPTIGARTPADGATVATSQKFTAVVTDASGVRSVTFVVNYGGRNYNFAGAFVGADTYETTVSGFTTGTSGSWTVVAKDNAGKGGNTATSSAFAFTVGGGGGGGGGIIANARWTFGGAVQTAVGRLLYEMPANGPNWSAYVCSGTVVTDGTSGRAIILTAAHCVYDDASDKFARNVIFIPNQDQTTGAGTDWTCTNDPIGCWAPGFGVVEQNWTNFVFPDNIPWDYAYYVVSDTGAHSGNGSGGALETAAGSLGIDFLPPYVNDGDPGPGSLDYTHGLGYSYSDDPFFMYCAEDMTTEGAANWWLASCDLSGGSSGGPWVQPMNEGTGSGPIISVNSWGYTTGAGMAGPFLSGTTAQCVFNAAKSASFSLASNPAGQQGLVVNPATCP